nr:hypothetical protein JVH1_6848 [Rhodococcus sp. JVH1]
MYIGDCRGREIKLVAPGADGWAASDRQVREMPMQHRYLQVDRV